MGCIANIIILSIIVLVATLFAFVFPPGLFLIPVVIVVWVVHVVNKSRTRSIERQTERIVSAIERTNRGNNG